MELIHIQNKTMARKYLFIDKINAAVINTSFKCRNKEKISHLLTLYQLNINYAE